MVLPQLGRTGEAVVLGRRPFEGIRARAPASSNYSSNGSAALFENLQPRLPVATLLLLPIAVETAAIPVVLWVLAAAVLVQLLHGTRLDTCLFLQLELATCP